MKEHGEKVISKSAAAIGSALSGGTLLTLQEMAQKDAHDVFNQHLITLEAIETLREQRDILLEAVTEAYKLNKNGYFAEGTLRKALDKCEVKP